MFVVEGKSRPSWSGDHHDDLCLMGSPDLKASALKVEGTLALQTYYIQVDWKIIAGSVATKLSSVTQSLLSSVCAAGWLAGRIPTSHPVAFIEGKLGNQQAASPLPPTTHILEHPPRLQSTIHLFPRSSPWSLSLAPITVQLLKYNCMYLGPTCTTSIFLYRRFVKPS